MVVWMLNTRAFRRYLWIAEIPTETCSDALEQVKMTLCPKHIGIDGIRSAIRRLHLLLHNPKER